MIGPHDLVGAFARNVAVVKSQAAGLSHAESLIQPPFRGNCLNWVIGHLVTNRDDVLATLDQPPVLGAAGAPYRRESEPLRAAESGVLPLADLLALLEQAQEGIAAALGPLDETTLAREVVVGERTTTVARRTFFLYFHETYHVGQTELLRQLAGKDDKII